MAILGAVAVPHPPVIVPQVGRGRERSLARTQSAYRQAAAWVAAWQPDTLVVISPHAPGYADWICLSPGAQARGDLAASGAPKAALTVIYDAMLRERWLEEIGREGLPAGTAGAAEEQLDHGTLIPLLYLRKAGVDCPVLRVGISGLSGEIHYRLGQCLARAAQQCGRRVAVVASGDLSHKLREDGPYGFAPEGPEFDRQCAQALDRGDFLWLLTVPKGLCRRAAECGLRSFQIMAGALDGQRVDARCLSYEGPFGVGYAVAVFDAGGPQEDRRLLPLYRRRREEDAWVRLARLSLEQTLRTGRRLIRLPDDLPDQLTQARAGVFVSLYRAGRLRGCIGTIAPTTESVAWEIVQNAVSAGTRDPRFPPVTEEELAALSYSVDVLRPMEPISGPQELDVRRYGVLVSCGGRRGLLLPNLDGVDTVEQQLRIAREKGGIGPEEPYTLSPFKVVRHR